jgi:arylsulfatase A-like enzyme
MRLVARWTVVPLICLVFSCGVESRRINLLIVAVDTLRRDHVGCYGYRRGTTPNIDRLAERSVLFEDAVSQSPWTLPSFATLFTSLYPSQHGAGNLRKRGSGGFGTRISTSFPPMAMMLLKQGYSTGAIINAPALAPELGVDRGFETYSAAPRWKERRADRTTRDALKWIDENSESPFFMFAHYFDPHLDYEPPAPYDTIFDPMYTGAIGSAFSRDDYSRMEETLSMEGDPYAQAEWDHIRALYDGEILFTDKAVGELLEGLEERGLAQNTLVVFMSDHGEEFFDHKGFEHGHTLYDELIKVPLMFSLPGRLPVNKRVDRQVRILDVLPTVLDILGIEPWTHLEGASLMPLITGEGDWASGAATHLPVSFAFSENMLYGTEKKSLTAHPWKLVYDTVTGEKMLFNLADDPGELHDIAGGDPRTEKLLSDVITKTLLGLSETWYVEIAGGSDSHVFDIEVSVPTRTMDGRITMHAFMDRDGEIVADDLLPLAELGREVIRIEGLRLGGLVTLAFKIAPDMVPVRFDFEIDGDAAREVTYMGEHLASPQTMPFSENAGRSSKAGGAPPERPEPPYILLWRSSTGFEPGDQVELGEDTLRQLKALGYIQ